LSAADDVAGQLRLSGSKRPRRSPEITHPERVSGLFILNTCARAAASSRFRCRCACSRRRVWVRSWSWACLFVRVFVFRVGVVHRERVTLEVRRAYVALHPSWSSRTGVLVFP
jgi:cis-3-alkyl-4-acyloxetan-2-one decarboxylase